jgi:hypothetical protein
MGSARPAAAIQRSGKGLRMDASALLNEDLGDRMQPRKAALPTTDAQLGV